MFDTFEEGFEDARIDADQMARLRPLQERTGLVIRLGADGSWHLFDLVKHGFVAHGDGLTTDDVIDYMLNASEAGEWLVADQVRATLDTLLDANEDIRRRAKEAARRRSEEVGEQVAESSYDDARRTERARAIGRRGMDGPEDSDGLIEVAGVDDQGRTAYQRTDKLDQMICKRNK